MNKLFIDIETIPSGDAPSIEEMMKHVPGNYSKQETINAWIEDNQEKVFRKRALSWFECRILCIGYAFNDQPVKYIIDTDEKLLLTMFYEEICKEIPEVSLHSSIHWIGYNIKEFDTPIITLRAIKYGLKELYSMLPKASKSPYLIDVMETGNMTAFKKYNSMKDLCKFFGIDAKTEMDGSMVYDYYLAEKYAEIGSYCAEDVDNTRKLHTLFR